MPDENDQIRVMLVDDHPILRVGLRVIEQVDPRISIVGEAGSLADARGKLEALRPTIVLLDLRLGDGDGLALCQEARPLPAGPRFICLTSYSEPHLVLRAMAAGVDGYLLKHNTPDRIVEAVHVVLRGGLALDPEVANLTANGPGGGPARPPDPLDSLSISEQRVLAEVAEGLTDKEVAATLGVSVKSVRKRLDRIFEKLQVRSRTQAALVHAAKRRSGNNED